jgi:hypothetical protein
MTDFSEFAGGNDEDLLWKAAIDDQTGEFFDKFNKNIAKTDSAVASKSSSMGGSLLKIAAIAGGVGAAFGGMASMLLKAVTGGITMMRGLAAESLNLRTEVDGLNESLEIVSKNAGYNAEETTKYKDALVDQGLTTREALQLMRQMIDGEVSLTKTTELMALAQDASIVSGTKVSEAYAKIIQVIAAQTEANAQQSNKQSAQMLKSLGLYVDFQAAFQRAALATGRTVEQLSAAERQQIALNAAITAGTQIAGAYESAQDSTARVIKALPGYYEEIKYAIGGMFEPAYKAAMTEWETFLKNLIEWLSANEDEITKLGEDLGNFVSGTGKLFLDLLLQIAEVLPKLITAIPDLADAIADQLGPAFGTSAEEMDKAGSTLQTFLKLVVLYSAAMGAAKKAAVDAYGPIAGNIALVQEAMMLKISAGALFGDPASENTKLFYEEYMRIFDELGKKYDLVADGNKKVEDATRATTTVQEQQAIVAQKLTDSLASANYKLQELKTSLEEEAAERAIQAGRDEIIAAINKANQIEDIERNHAERIREILESVNDSRTELAQQASENRLEIERDYQARLQEILSNFNFEAGELARKRDAVGLLSLMRQNKQQLSSEARAVAERRAKAEQSYQQAIQDLDKSLQNQLRKAEEARNNDYESLNRSLARQAELKNLYAQWEAEDRQRKLDAQLADMWEGFKAMDGMTQAGLDKILADWGAYYNALNTMQGMWRYNANEVPAGSISVPNVPAGSTIYGTHTYNPATRNTGQAGQVSTLLINSIDTANLKSIPSVAPRSSKDVNDMHITVDGTGLDPYIQRVVANTLLEIERNKG